MTIAIPSGFCAAGCSKSFYPWQGAMGTGIQELAGELRAETGNVSIEIRLVEPTVNDRHLFQLVELQLERRTWTGGIVAVRWTTLKLWKVVPQPQGTWFLG